MDEIKITPNASEAAAVFDPKQDRRYVDDFAALVATMQEGLAEAIALNKVFVTSRHDNIAIYPNYAEENAPDNGLFTVYLKHVKKNSGDYSYHRCRCCQMFLNRYGSALSVDTNTYVATSVLWHPEKLDPSNYYYDVCVALKKNVEEGRVSGTLVVGEEIWGKPEWGGWDHLSVDAQGYKGLVEPDAALGVGNTFEEQAKQIFKVMHDPLINAHRETVAKIVANKMIWREDVIEHFSDLIQKYHTLDAFDRAVFSHHHSANGPGGLTGLRNGIYGALCIDLDNKPSIEDAIRAHNARMDPEKYRQMEAAASEQLIKRARALFSELNAERSLLWRMAGPEDLTRFLWNAPHVKLEATEKPFDPFGKLLDEAKAAPPKMTKTLERMSWLKFQRDLLPRAEKVEYLIQGSMYQQKQPFMFFMAMTHPDSAPLVKWDHAEKRNPLSAFGFVGGIEPFFTSLAGTARVEVSAITVGPEEQLSEEAPKSALFLLKDLTLTHEERQTFTPVHLETVRSEFFPVQRALSDVFERTPMTDYSKSAAGVSINPHYVYKERSLPLIFEITTDNGTVIHPVHLDRWE